MQNKSKFFSILILLIIFSVLTSILIGCGKKEEEKEDDITFTLKTDRTIDYEDKSKSAMREKLNKITKEKKEAEKEKKAIEEAKPKIPIKSAVDLFSEGRNFYQQKKYSKALEKYEAIVNEHAKNDLAPEAQFIIGQIYSENLKLFPLAQKAFKNLIRIYPDYIKNDLAQFYIANALYNEGRYADAIFEYRKVYENYPQTKLSEKAIWEIGNIYYAQLKEYKEAIIFFKQLDSEFPKSSNRELANLLIGNIYLDNLYNEDLALDTYNNFLKRFPNSSLRSKAEEGRQKILIPRQEAKKRQEEELRRRQEIARRKKLEEERKHKEEEERKNELKRIEEEKKKEIEKQKILAQKKKEAEKKKQLALLEEEKKKQEKLKELEKNKQEIIDVIHRHEQAMEDKNINVIKKNWYTIPKSELEGTVSVFNKFSKINVTIDYSEIEMNTTYDNASVSLQQDLTLVSDVDDREIKTSINMKWDFIKDKGVWKINKTEVIK